MLSFHLGHWSSKNVGKHNLSHRAMQDSCESDQIALA